MSTTGRESPASVEMVIPSAEVSAESEWPPPSPRPPSSVRWGGPQAQAAVDAPGEIELGLGHGDGRAGTDMPTWDDMRSLLKQSEATERNLMQRISNLENDEKDIDIGDTTATTSSSLSRRMRRRASKWKFEKYELPQSTFTLMITEDILSFPFFMGVVAAALSITSLSIVLFNELGKGTADSPIGMPAGVDTEVKVAQLLGVMIGVLMEEEIPLGLEIIGKCVEQHKLGRYPFHPAKVICSSLLRIIVGTLFLACLFFAVLQEDDVLNIFFDVLALEFVENIDDVIYALSKRGFFGKKLRVATYVTATYEPPGDAHTRAFSRWVKRIVGFVYFMNAVVMIFGLLFLMMKQQRGAFRCTTISIAFTDDVWEESWVELDNGEHEIRLLIYSHFNGIYVENGTHDGRPKYTEQNKEDGMPYQETVGAEIIYCKVLESWVFKHDKISTSPQAEYEENECSWLLKSPETGNYDIIEVGHERSWQVWTGRIETDYAITISCNECNDHAGCNYHGYCDNDNQVCICNKGEYYGIHCEYDMPCEVIRSEKNETATLHLLHDHENSKDPFVQVYGHPKYANNMSGIPEGLMKLAVPNDDAFKDDDFFDIHNEIPSFVKQLENYTFILKYTGRRWYGQIAPPGLVSKNFHEEEYHAFWDKSFSGLGVDDNKTVIISAPATDASPVGVDFYEMRRRNKKFETSEDNYDYSPFGVLLPLVGSEGAGYFHCNHEKLE